MISLCGGRNVKFMTTLLLLLPAIAAGFALQNPDTPFLTFVMLAALSGVGALPFVLSVGAFLVARLNSVDEVVPGDAPVRVSFAGVFMVGLFVVGLALLFAGGSQGFRALDEIRNAWPRRYGAGLAVFGAWAGVLLGANAAIMVATFGFWDVPGELNGEAPGFTALILLAADVAFLVWYRLRFVLECRAE
jgi:hypothetical protein